MAKQPTTPKSLQSRNQAPPVGESGVGIAPSSRPNPDTDFKQPNTAGQQGAQRHDDMFTQTKPDDERGGPADQSDTNVDHSELTAEEQAELEAAKLNAPTVDEDEDPDAEIDRREVVEADESNEDDDEEVLVRLLHDQGHHHVNGHPLEGGTVIKMKRGDFKRDQTNGVRAEEVEDDYDGEVYDTSEAWKPETEEA